VPQIIFEARIGLISFAGGVDDLIKKVPDQLKSDTGLVYDRIHWRIKKRKYDSALNLLLEIKPIRASNNF
jgi:soluble lytic murein transglycosylase